MAVEFRMEHLELKPSDLADILGGRNRVSEILKQEKEADSRDDAVFAQTPRYPR
jgi:antitoxin component HigA of HigAB toxin-antitoxin module